MSKFKIIVGVIITLITTVFGVVASGIVYDALWYAGDSASVNINKCDIMPHDWKVQCENVKAEYESGKKSIQLVIGIAPFIGFVLILYYKF